MFAALRSAAPAPLRSWLDTNRPRVEGLIARATGGPVPFSMIRRGDRIEALLVGSRKAPGAWVSGRVVGAMSSRGTGGTRAGGYLEVETAAGVGALRPGDVSAIRIRR